MLSTLKDNGGLTKTRALLPGSPAINAGGNTYPINPISSQPLQFDQRNFQRIFPNGSVIDMGAFELGASIVPAVNAPDLRDASDTGMSETDNITKATVSVLDISNVIPGAKVELLRNNVVISSTIATLFSVSLTDSNPPLDGVVQYTSRQTIGGVISANSSSLSVTYDHTSPTVTINQRTDQADPATNYPILFTVVVSEPAGGLESDDISFAGSTADLSNAAVWISATSSSTYSIEITGIRSPGTIVATIRAGAVYDRVINPSTASTSTDNSITFQPAIIDVSVGGRIRRISALAKTTTTITFTDNLTGEVWKARTNPLGYYRLTGLKIYQHMGSRFTVRIDNKSFVYIAPLPLLITASRNNLNYTIP